MARSAEEGMNLGALDHFARVHHGDCVRDLRHHAEIVRDQEDAHVMLAPQPVDEREDLGWIVTSRAVVGSSAISSRGLQDMASAIITRWRMPPDIWCG